MIYKTNHMKDGQPVIIIDPLHPIHKRVFHLNPGERSYKNSTSRRLALERKEKNA